MTRGNEVERVEPGSIADELEIAPGDTIVAINGENPSDILDWRLAESSEDILLVVQHADGELVEYEIEKDFDEPLGIVFASPTLDDIRSCQNRCVFCFVDQMPPAMRSTLYIKDDDYRLSFLSGSYITLTNLREEDVARIERLHLSPLYVSVHTTDSQLRRRMMNHKRAGEVLPLLKRLTEAGIEFHTQVVLCPGLNDKEALDQTITDLYGLYPGVKSLAVVPVGLTGHREKLYPLSPCDKSHAQEVLEQLTAWQKKCLQESKTRFVFAADEFYNMADKEVPDHHWYEGYPQLENGVGLLRLLLNDWEKLRQTLPDKIATEKNVAVVTGSSAVRYLEPIMDRLNKIEGLNIRLIGVQNRFFGGHVTVTGLLTASDIITALKDKEKADRIYLPAVMLKEGKELFLDGYTINDLAQELNTDLRVVNDLDNFLTDLL
ncbi:DUF512 domain-containing protein [Dethiobacter alkaliphilus]|uniref:DUF512 domain-containing protein n=1 Tax=Dethiobacter alkaliphilus TaxID=427926 RepID=UPI002225BC93|nr:DUF512 domain-containing protein [Dethiobacter alkaliphilus]MCW3491509.1 DUF512 domain-containing protein [Dethiobacter alkaliphilus]